MACAFLTESRFMRTMQPLRERILHFFKENQHTTAQKAMHAHARALRDFQGLRSEWFSMCALQFITLHKISLKSPKSAPYFPNFAEFSEATLANTLSIPNDRFLFQTLHIRENITARIDLLEKHPDGTHTLFLFEQKLNINRKAADLVERVKFKLWVASANRRIRKVEVVSINPDFVGPFQSGRIPSFFKRTVFTETPQALIANLTANEIRKFSETEKLPEIQQKLAEPTSVLHIPRISTAKLQTAIETDVIDVTQPSIESIKWSPQQMRYIDCCRKQKPVIRYSGIRAFLRKFNYPRHYLDFESVPLEMPPWAVKPFEQMPFQFSMHVQNKHGDPLGHFSYLHLDVRNAPTSDPRKELIAALCDAVKQIGPNGTIIAHHASFEEKMLKNLSDYAKAHLGEDYAKMLEHMGKRLIDLEKVFAQDYIDPRFLGSTSLKKIQPVIAPSRSYAALEGSVADGQKAGEVYAMWVLQPQQAFWVNAQRKALLEYCALDTQVMVDVVGHLEEVSQEGSVE